MIMAESDPNTPTNKLFHNASYNKLWSMILLLALCLPISNSCHSNYQLFAVLTNSSHTLSSLMIHFRFKVWLN